MSDGRMGIEESADIVTLLSEAQSRDALHYFAETPDQRHVGGGYVVTVRELTRTRSSRCKDEARSTSRARATRHRALGSMCARDATRPGNLEAREKR